MVDQLSLTKRGEGGGETTIAGSPILQFPLSLGFNRAHRADCVSPLWIGALTRALFGAGAKTVASSEE